VSRYDKPDGGQARRSVGQHAVLSMRPSFAASRARPSTLLRTVSLSNRLAWRPGGLVTNSREYCRLVFSVNVGARSLWDKLGFNVLGVIPGAVQKDDGTYQDAMIMCRSLLD
jgi:hypothetical protein